MEIKKVVEIINQKDHPVYLPQSDNPKEDKIIPAHGRVTYMMSPKQLEYLKASLLQFNIKN